MPPDANTRRLLYKIAHVYYEDGLSQKQIGLRFGLSRIKVSRMLKQAKDLKIVQITLSPGNERTDRLEHEMETVYGLDEAIVISSESMGDQKSNLRGLGAAAAECLVRGIQGDETIAITWGHSILAVVDALPAANWPNVQIVQTLGGLSQPDSKINAGDLARRTAQTLGANLTLLSSPGIVESKSIRDALMNDPQIKRTLSLAAKANIALIGIGVPNSTTFSLAAVLKEKDIQRLISRGIVGDIGLQFYNENCVQVADELHDYVIGLSLAQYKAIPRVIAVAGGIEKVHAIKAALKGKIINVLVTDEITAIELLRTK
ncbi:MAG TPA: sugar-binding transcriptional regulator [Leptolinea sp.]